MTAPLRWVAVAEPHGTYSDGTPNSRWFVTLMDHGRPYGTLSHMKEEEARSLVDQLAAAARTVPERVGP